MQICFTLDSHIIYHYVTLTMAQDAPKPLFLPRIFLFFQILIPKMCNLIARDLYSQASCETATLSNVLAFQLPPLRHDRGTCTNSVYTISFLSLSIPFSHNFFPSFFLSNKSQGRSQDFSKGRGHTVSKWGYSPDCHYSQDIVMAFSPAVVGCLVKKGLQKGGHGHGTPLATPLNQYWVKLQIQSTEHDHI